MSEPQKEEKPEEEKTKEQFVRLKKKTEPKKSSRHEAVRRWLHVNHED